MLASSDYSSPLASGGEGYRIENEIQTTFFFAMIAELELPPLPGYRITKMEFQVNNELNYDTDDLLLDLNNGTGKIKQLTSIKSNCNITSICDSFHDFALDYQKYENDVKNGSLYFAIATSFLPNASKPIIDLIAHAKDSANTEEFIQYTKNMPKRAKNVYSKLETTTNKVNGSNLYEILRHTNLYVFDYVVESANCPFSFTKSLVYNASKHKLVNNINIETAWCMVASHISRRNARAEPISLNSIPPPIRDLFVLPSQSICPTFDIGSTPELSLISAFDLSNEYDADFVSSLTNITDKNILRRELHKYVNQGLIFMDGDSYYLEHREEWLQNGLDNLSPRVIHAFIVSAFDTIEKVSSNVFISSSFLNYHNINTTKAATCSPILHTAILRSLSYIAQCTQKEVHAESLKGSIVHEIRKLFQKQQDNWEFWATFKDNLYLLAIMDPSSFLDAIKQLFAKLEEDKNKQLLASLSMSSFFQPISYALAKICWDERHINDAAPLLAKITQYETSDTALDYLCGVFVPWRPQTYASAHLRVSTIKNIIEKFPCLDGKMLAKLLSHEYASISVDPPAYLKKNQNDIKIDPHYEWGQYSKILINRAKHSFNCLLVLCDNIPYVKAYIWQDFISLCSQDFLNQMNDDEKLQVIKRLANIIESGSMTDDEQSSIITLIKKINISSIHKKYSHLFSYATINCNNATIKEQQKTACSEALGRGLNELILLAKESEYPWILGETLSDVFMLTEKNISELLSSKYKKVHMMLQAYLYCHKDSLNYFYKIEDKEKVALLAILPITNQVLDLVDSLPNPAEYWNILNPDCRDLSIEVTQRVLRGLKDNKRYLDAIPCMHQLITNGTKNGNLQNIDTTLLYSILTNINTKKQIDDIFKYWINDIIKFLQASTLNKAKKLRLELKFLFLYRFYDFNPKTIIEKIQNDPEYCQKLLTKSRCIYYRGQYLPIFLNSVRFIPGGDLENHKNIATWIDKFVKCRKDEKSAYYFVGKVLARSCINIDHNRISIPDSILNILNSCDHNAMRHGFANEILYPSGGRVTNLPEEQTMNIANNEYWSRYAESIDSTYPIFAVTCREISDGFIRNAEWERTYINTRQKLLELNLDDF